MSESPASIQKFNDYIASLSPQQAQLILQDEELTGFMRSDNYWEPQVKTFARRAVSLPLSAYPAGSYFTVNKSACTDHSQCSATIPSSKPSGVVTTKCYISNTKQNGNCIRYEPTGAIQCRGFADYVFNQYFGVNVADGNKMTIPTSVSTIKAITTTDKTGATDVQNFFVNVPVGSNLRVTFRNANTNHSIIISAKTSTGVTVYDCNGSGSNDCKVATTTRTWEQFATKYKAIVNAWKV